MSPAFTVPVRPPVVHPRLAALLAAADRAGSRWCLLRGASDLHVPGGEVDLLAHRDDVGRLERGLAAAGAAAVAAPGRGTHRFHLAYDAASDSWLKLDVVTELEFGTAQELRTRAAAAVLARRRRLGSVVVPAPADAFWALLLHELLDRRTLRDDDGTRAELATLARAALRDDSPLRGVVDAACPAGWSATRIAAVAARGGTDELAPLRAALIACWPDGGPAVRRARVVRAHARRRLHRAAPTSGMPGAIVAVTGADGAARAAAAEALAAAWPAPARTVRQAGLAGAALARLHRGAGRLAIIDADGATPARTDATLSVDASADRDAGRRLATDHAWRRAAGRRGHSTEAMTSYSLSRSTG